MKKLLWTIILVMLGAGCTRVDLTEVRVRDPHAVGVVADANNVWLLPPKHSPETVEVYRNAALTATLARRESGALAYTSEHWALGKRVDTTPLLDDQGRTHWAGSPAASKSLEEAIDRGGEVRMHSVEVVRETGPLGTCNGTTLDSCETNPAVPMSLATESRNVAEVDVVRTPVRSLGVAELVFGSVSVGLGVADGAVLLPRESTPARNIALGIGAGLIAVGGLAIANGLWRVLAPEQRVTYRPSGS